MASADAYNFETYRRDVNDELRLAFPVHLRVGELAPPFRLPTVDGGVLDLSEQRAKGHVVLIFGCYTAPPCLAQLPSLEALSRLYGGRGVSFGFVYTREVHPGEVFSPHKTSEQKLDQARRLRERARITFPVAVDDLDGTVHHAYGSLPSMAWVVHRDGTVVYRGSWTEADVIREVIENLLVRDRAEATGGAGRFGYHEWLRFMPREGDEHWEVLHTAGPKAWADYRRANGLP